MKSKKIVMLVSGVCGLALICGVANKSFALITNPVEKRIIEKIEEDRHKSNASELLTKDLCSYINNSEYSKEFRTYCLSVSVKCMDSKTLENLIKELPNGIDWCDYENDNFAYLFYRCASKINDGISERNIKTREFVNNVFNKGIGYLISNSFAPESFKNKSNVYKLGYLKSICTIGSEKLTNLENISISEISQKISKIKCEDLGTDQKVLLTYAKIPGEQQKTEGIKALKAITGDVKSVEDFEKFLNNERKLGKEVLMQLARIPHDDTEELSALKAIIGGREFGEFLNDERKLGKEVLLQLAKIPHDDTEQLSALKAITGDVKSVEDFEKFLNDERKLGKEELGKEVLLQLAKIPHDDTEQLSALKAIIGGREFGEFLNDERKLGKEVLLQLAKIPHDDTEQLSALKAITGDVKSVEDFEKFLNDERKLGKEELGKEVLLQLARIPGEQQKTEGIEALKAIIGKREFGEFLNDEGNFGGKVLMQLARIPEGQQEKTRIEALRAIIRGRDFGKFLEDEGNFGGKVLMQLARIPHDSKEQLSALRAIIRGRDFEKFLEYEGNFGGKVLLQLAMIPGEQQKTEGIEALKAIIGKREFGEFLNDERKLGKEVLLQLARIPHDSKEQLLALRAIIRGRDFGKFLEDEGNFGGKVLMQLARIPHDSTEQISALEAVYKPKKLRLYYEKQIKTISNNILGNIMKKRSNENSNEDLVFRLNSMIKGSERRGQKKCCSRNQQFVGYNDGYYCVSEDEDKVSGSVNPNGSCNRLRINHRFTKSKSECIKKQDMGMARPRYRKKNDGSLLWSRQK